MTNPTSTTTSNNPAHNQYDKLSPYGKIRRSRQTGFVNTQPRYTPEEIKRYSPLFPTRCEIAKAQGND